MVKVRPSKHGKLNKVLTKRVISEIFGKALILRKVTDTTDAFGQLSDRTTSDTTFTGDLQFGLNIDKRLLKMGVVEVGDAVLYIEPEALTNRPEPEDLILDGNSRWEVLSEIEKAELGGTVIHYSYRCKRRIESDDS